MHSRLGLTRQQILAFRRRVGGLDQRMPEGSESLRRAAWAGLQDSMPRAALLSLHARVQGVEPSTWEHPSLAQLWGPRYSTYVVAKRDFALFSLGRLPESGKGRLRAERIAEQLRLHLDGARMTDREAGSALGIIRTRSGTPRRRARSPSAGRARERRPSGRSAHPRSTRPTPVASSLGATSTSSGRRRPMGSPAGQGSPGAPRPTPSPRSRARCSRSDRRSATSCCSQTTSRPFVPPRPRPHPRACCRAAMPTSCSTEPSGICSSRGPIGGRALDVARVAGRAPRRRRDPRNLEARAAHRADRRLGTPVAWDARRDRGRGGRPAPPGCRPADRGGLEHVKCARHSHAPRPPSHEAKAATLARCTIE